MLLAMDIGNTVVTMGVFEDAELITTLRVATDTRRLADEYGVMVTNSLVLKGVSPKDITAVCLCSVVPPLTVVFTEVCDTLFNADPLIVSAGVRTGLPILYDNPRDVGADRIADAVAAIDLYGSPLIVVDLGTATVFDAISRKGEYLGGAIAPGINLAADSLFFNTSQLRRVELIAPETAIGHSTITALQSGLVLGYTGLISTMVQRFKDKVGSDAKVIGTGGLINVISQQESIFDEINRDLTLLGLRFIYNLNQGDNKPGKRNERTTYK